MKLIESGKLGKSVNQNDVRRFIVSNNVTEEGEVANKQILSIDMNRFEGESLYDGFYAVTTDLSDKAGTIIKVNKGRWEIEESFRIMKTEFEAI